MVDLRFHLSNNLVLYINDVTCLEKLARGIVSDLILRQIGNGHSPFLLERRPQAGYFICVGRFNDALVEV